MRRIDRVVGVPLCALATVILSGVWRVWRRPPRPIKRVLFIELSEMGTTILADPAMRRVREQTGAETYFVIFDQNAESLALTETVPRQNVFTIANSSLWRLVLDTLSFLRWVRRNDIDTVIDLELFSRFTALLSGLSGADRRVGFHRFHDEGLYRGELLTHRVAYNPHIHIAQNFISLVDALASEPSTVPLSRRIVENDQVHVRTRPATLAARESMWMKIRSLVPRPDLIRPTLVLINPNASELLPQRRWMPERFAELVKRILAEHHSALVLITGAPSERAAAENLASQCGSDRCVAFAGHTKLTELTALYALAAVMVTNDSGPAHFAAASGLPTIVLFGPETPNLYRPLGTSIPIHAGLSCSPCVSASNHRKTSCGDNVCMRAISVEQVFRAVNVVLTSNKFQKSASSNAA